VSSQIAGSNWLEKYHMWPTLAYLQANKATCCQHLHRFAADDLIARSKVGQQKGNEFMKPCLGCLDGGMYAAAVGWWIVAIQWIVITVPQPPSFNLGKSSCVWHAQGPTARNSNGVAAKYEARTEHTLLISNARNQGGEQWLAQKCGQPPSVPMHRGGPALSKRSYYTGL